VFIMSLQGPVIVVADEPVAELVAALGNAGVSPVVETRWRGAAMAIAQVRPAAIILADAAGDPGLVASFCRPREGEPFLPVIARVPADCESMPGTLPIAADAPFARLQARLAAAMRIRALHATLLRRQRSGENYLSVVLPSSDPIEDATVLVIGRGRSYPTLAVAVGEQAGLIGALSVETAARHLTAREIDGVVIGDGLSARMVDGFLLVLSEESRFRDLPIALLRSHQQAPDPEGLPHFERDGDPRRLVERFLPLVRMHALEGRLKRVLKSLDADGMLDPETGLLRSDAFRRDLGQAMAEAARNRTGLSLTRISFDQPQTARTVRDAARLVSRLLRSNDFGCCESDGSIVAVFTQTDLSAAHVAARRIASLLKTTILSDTDTPTYDPTVTLATLKPHDTLGSLMARVTGMPAAVAAE
jgi:hypothetical protein